ncbi:MAG: ribulose bisphosphate carboxylase small subunit [Cyanobacteria bacterium J06573_11]
MVAPTPRLALSINPSVDSSADVHEFSLVEGDVSIGAGSRVSPGTAVTAEQGASVKVGVHCQLLPGVTVEGTAGSQVINTASAGSETASVCVGDRTIVAHKSLIHSPAFIGKDCFIGFRSTVFNARLGDGCIVLMHALVQDVEIPPGRCVPSGSVITSQHQANQLPTVRPEDLEFAKEVTGASAQTASASFSSQRSDSGGFNHNTRNGSGYGSVSRQSGARLVPVHSTHSTPHATEGAPMPTQRLSPEIVQQVRQYLAQGYRIGMEHADARRYRSGVWETCTPIKDTREQAVFGALENCLAEHAGEYVRMFGIDTQMKRRVGMVTVQRPSDKPMSGGQSSSQRASAANNGSYSGGYATNNNGASSSGLTTAIMQEVSNLLRAGYIIGTEHADNRRYRSNVWKSCSPIRSTREQEVFSHLQHCLEEHAGEYVRMFGIDPQAKRRISTTTIQRADGKPVDMSASRPVQAASGGNSNTGSSQSYGSSNSYASSGSNGAAADAAGQILRSGNQIGVEMADARRYRSGIWQTAPTLRSANELQAFLNKNADKYVRIFGVNQAQKTRGAATTVQKPGQKVESASSQGVSTNGAKAARGPINTNPPRYDDPPNQPGGMEANVMDQVTQLVNQGFRISVEFADKRRFRSGIWRTGEAINARRPAEAISALGKQLAQHQGSYVRLVGVDPQAKRRVLETTIQRP